VAICASAVLVAIAVTSMYVYRSKFKRNRQEKFSDLEKSSKGGSLGSRMSNLFRNSIHPSKANPAPPLPVAYRTNGGKFVNNNMDAYSRSPSPLSPSSRDNSLSRLMAASPTSFHSSHSQNSSLDRNNKSNGQRARGWSNSSANAPAATNKGGYTVRRLN
jgi:hypothetical protein